MAIADSKLRDILAELDYIPRKTLDEALEQATEQNSSLQKILTERDLISDADLGRLIADAAGLPFVSLSGTSITPDILRLTPPDIAAKFRVISFGLGPQGLQVASSEPEGNDELFGLLAKKAGVSKFRAYLATESDILNSLTQYQKQLQEVFDGLVAATASTQSEPPVAKIVATMIEYAYHAQASDIHIEPSRTTTTVRYRIDGILHDMLHLPKSLHNQLITRIKVLSRLRTDEHLSAQDGRLRIVLEDESNLDVRVSIVPIVSGEKAVLRLLSSHYRQFGLTDLGLYETDLDKVRRGFSRPYGLVLSTGPTGSGKTTTIYAVLKILNTRDKNIATIEDPIEYEVDGLNQIQANQKTNLTFSSGLRSILRQDPNIIYVGEIRDEETADIAINSATTGHLVLSTLHTNDAATALIRLIDMKVEPFLVASTVNTIIAQRLVRKICDHCKVSTELKKTAKGWNGESSLAVQLGSLPLPLVVKHLKTSANTVRVYNGKGCATCHQTGYTGRVGIFEVLDVSPAIAELVAEKASSDVINASAIKEGMTSMLEDGLGKVQRGVTSLEEILRVTSE